MFRARVRCHAIVLLTLASVLTLGGTATQVAATTNPLDVVSPGLTGPISTGAVCTGPAVANLIVTGEQFTPGGKVDVMLYQRGSTRPSVIRSLRASQSISSPHSSADPTRGYQHGGFVGITLGHWCEQTALVRAYDWQTATWSNQLDVVVGCEPAT